MDDIDLQILELLKSNGRMTSSEISKIVHLSVPSITERIRKLENNGVIDQFTVKLNRKAIGQTLLVYIFVQLHGSVETQHFRTTIIQSPLVLECHHISGEYDYLLKVGLPDLSELEGFITHTLKANHDIVRSNTVFILSTLKEE
ncbi:Lrp/AsnC family transcriptional regulator [Paenibacillus sp. FSL R5-0887]|jgi:Lrp/AsnC family leucine-responsive transcriptional regulator|nr:Lrp/AsnC family transcriptional regulator [Paenibacillus odorifer]OMD56596.1 transcriptional regulator [Paenibacillus odorifer]OMD65343.1 transcriptional regulator [Paenibacillus odorifer]OMD80789.1 transcriptional regulator [Paenibacillus odorifer]OMD82384.1 transcriptional regulator [Paenibacillus odorifer]OME05930.1 transcriptional regulator [Paenibacillus odorifer]